MSQTHNFALALALASLMMVGCDGSGSTSSGDASGPEPMKRTIAACPVELSRSQAEGILGVSLPDSGHSVTAAMRQCQWFTGFTWASWSWYKSGTLASMMSTYEKNTVRTLGGDSGSCVREEFGGITQDYIVRRKTVGTLQTVRIQPAESCVADGVNVQVWVECAGGSLAASARNPKASTSTVWAASEAIAQAVCTNTK
jgi:hypothetical protein